MRLDPFLKDAPAATAAAKPQRMPLANSDAQHHTLLHRTVHSLPDLALLSLGRELGVGLGLGRTEWPGGPG